MAADELGPGVLGGEVAPLFAKLKNQATWTTAARAVVTPIG